MLKTEVLKLIKDADSYISGQEICERLGVSRTAVWKGINQLKEEGYQIEAVKNKGYYLVDVPDVVTEAEILSRMQTAWAGKTVRYYASTDSTNSRIKALADQGAVHGTLAVADFQEAGKGRRGRQWFSPPGTGIWMSILLRPELMPDKASMLTLVTAMAAVKAIEEASGVKAWIKWPNDIVLNGKKVCGILTEMNAEPDYIHYVIIGIGINVNRDEFPEELHQTATSLLLESGKKVMRSELICQMWKYFEEYYAVFLRDGDLSGLVEEYNKKLINLNREVRVLAPKHEWNGTAEGIDCLGELVVRQADGKRQTVNSGEVSVRGIYGYV